MAKTGYETSILHVRRVYRYLTHNQANMTPGLSTTQAATLAATIAQLATYLAQFPKQPLNP